MANFFAEFAVDAAPDARQFMERLTSIGAGSALRTIPASSPVSMSMIHNAPDGVSALISYSSRELNNDWHTTALVTRHDAQATARVEMLPLNQHSSLYRPQKPAIIDMLLDGLGGIGQTPFKPQKTGIEVSNKYVAHVERLVAGTSSNQTPVLYTTREFLTQKALDEQELVNRLYGLATVFIESDKHVSKKLKKRLGCNDTTPLLWPACLVLPVKTGTRPVLHCADQWQDSGDSLLNFLQELLQQNRPPNRQPSNQANWIAMNRALFSGVDPLPGPVLPPQISHAPTATVMPATPVKRVNDATQSEPTRLELNRGVEEDLVDGEVAEMVLDAVEHFLKNKLTSDPSKEAESCRRADVLRAVLSANTPAPRNLRKFRDRVKKVLDGTRGINKRTELELNRIGIQVSQGGKHPKLTLSNDSRYVLTAPSSSSDGQAWHYVVRDIEQKFF